MAQQLQQPPGFGQQGIGQQMGGGQIPTMPGVEPARQLPSEFRTLLDDVSKTIDVLEWEKTLAIQSGPQAAPLVQAADDVAEVGKLVKELVARDSMLAPQALQLFTQASQQALGTFQQQQGQVPGIERVTATVTQTLESAQRVQQRVGGQGFQQQPIQQQPVQPHPASQQFAGQQPR